MSFTQAEIEELEFLTWPPTESERIERETQQLAEAAERVRLSALRKQVETRSLATTQNAIDGKLADEPVVVQGIKLVLSRSGHSFSNGEIHPSGPSGTEVLSLVEQLQAIGVTDARLRSFTCSRVGVQFDTDPVPSWTIEMRLPVTTVVWLFLWSWYEQHQVSQSPTIEIDWKDGNEPMSSWASLSGLWPELESAQGLSPMMDEISHPFMSHPIPASQEKDVATQNVMSRLEYWAYGHGYCGKGIPRYVRKLCAVNRPRCLGFGEAVRSRFDWHARRYEGASSLAAYPPSRHRSSSTHKDIGNDRYKPPARSCGIFLSL